MTKIKKRTKESMTREIIKKIDELFIEDEISASKALLLLPAARYCLSEWLEGRTPDELLGRRDK